MRFTHFLGTTAAAAVVSLGMAGSAFADGHSKDIVDTAVEAGSFTTLVAAVQAAGLEDTLRGEGPFTVFAPTDEAFAALPEGTVENLLLPENLETLQAVLTYHVLPGKVMSADIAGQELSVATVEGSEVMVNATDGVMVDSANVVTADIETSNGVIHVIDAVILPPSAM
ncbi:fasciclin domain-containing protein [Ahrensia marina]|uniref:fasciclin domain-containing protein n=1 Tax=Ahrensia marina TaxID=1514904 RepID=UPI0035CF80DD